MCLSVPIGGLCHNMLRALVYSISDFILHLGPRHGGSWLSWGSMPTAPSSSAFRGQWYNPAPLCISVECTPGSHPGPTRGLPGSRGPSPGPKPGTQARVPKTGSPKPCQKVEKKRFSESARLAGKSLVKSARPISRPLDAPNVHMRQNLRFQTKKHQYLINSSYIPYRCL